MPGVIYYYIILLYDIILYHIILYYMWLPYITLHYIILYHIIKYYIMLCYIILLYIYIYILDWTCWHTPAAKFNISGRDSQNSVSAISRRFSQASVKLQWGFSEASWIWESCPLSGTTVSRRFTSWEVCRDTAISRRFAPIFICEGSYRESSTAVSWRFVPILIREEPHVKQHEAKIDPGQAIWANLHSR